MWDKWKKKIENFIWKEIDEDNDNDDFEQRQEFPSDIKTRIVYQYPKDSTYHIPQINSHNWKSTNRNIDIETPAYLRKNAKQVQSPIETTKQPMETPNKKKPFVTSDVPSPIYGYRNRMEKKKVDTVPAYMRKKERIVPENRNDHSTVKLIEQDIIQSDSSHQYDDAPIINDTKDTLLNIGTKEIDYNSKVSENDNIEENIELKDDMTAPLEKDVSPKEDVVSSIKTKSVTNNTVPYNVIMTPADKRKQFIRQEQQRLKESSIRQEQPVHNVERKQEIIPFHLLNDPVRKSNLNAEWLREQQRLLEQTLKHFQVRARVVNATQGPAVTRFEVHPELGVKVSKVKNLSDDLKLNMSARDIRIEAPIPGKNTIGIEVPNPSSQMVGLQEILNSNTFKESTSPLTIALGLNIEGVPVATNIQKMPHGLIAGATGSGKSVCINAILLSLIYNAHHDDVKFLLIDPKMVELAPYNGIPHLVSPVITDVKAATQALKWAVNEMEDRYERFVQEGVRDIERYNQKIVKQNRAHEKMPFIVIVIDELADLMMVSPQDVEDAISRIAQKARACGIHLLLATQRPSVDVLTGLIKANIPTRIAFSVSSQIDSRTIIDTAGAEKLLGKGDMLFIENGAGQSVRLQGPFVSDEEIERVTNYVRSIAEPDYLFEQESLLNQYVQEEEEDELLQEAIQFIFDHNSASTSLLQRQFKIGYNRAARLMDTLENKGIISGQNGSKPREILITKTELDELLSVK